MIDLAITADHIRTVIGDYLDAYPEDRQSLAPALELLDDGADITTRKEFRGHATAAVILVDPDGRILHIRHLILDSWLLPGGHLEASDATLLEAALRELAEETGIPVAAVTPAGERPLQIDIHSIPANPAKGEPDHRHIDFRFLLHTTNAIGPLQAEEVTAAAWHDPDSISDPILRQRVTRALH